MTELWRKLLTDKFGSEIVVECCRLHKGHYNGGRWGNCGECGRRPVIVPMTWEQEDEKMSQNRENNDV